MGSQVTEATDRQRALHGLHRNNSDKKRKRVVVSHSHFRAQFGQFGLLVFFLGGLCWLGRFSETEYQ